MLPSLDLVSVIVQSGAVGLLLVVIFLGYRLAVRLITVGANLFTNHMAHVEAALLSMEKSMTRFDAAVERYFEREHVDKPR